MVLNINSDNTTALKICGITQIDQALEIASLGVDAIGVIGVKNSPRFLQAQNRRKLFNELEIKAPKISRVWVVADIENEELLKAIEGKGVPSIIQLHGNESIQRCSELKVYYPKM